MRQKFFLLLLTTYATSQQQQVKNRQKIKVDEKTLRTWGGNEKSIDRRRKTLVNQIRVGKTLCATGLKQLCVFVYVFVPVFVSIFVYVLWGKHTVLQMRNYHNLQSVTADAMKKYISAKLPWFLMY